MGNVYSLKLNNKEINYGIIGSGNKTLVMFPGISLVSVLDSLKSIEYSFKPYLNDYKIYVFDRFKPSLKQNTFDDLVNERIETLDRLNIKDAYFYGVSMGGMLALKISIIRPDLIKKLAVVSTTSIIDKPRYEVLNRWKDMADNNRLEDLYMDFFKVLFTDDFYNKFKNVLISSINNVDKEDAYYFSKVIKLMDKFNVYDELNKIKVDTYVFCGSEDVVFFKESSKEIADKLNCGLYIFDGYRHGVYDEASDYKEKLFNFFNS